MVILICFNIIVKDGKEGWWCNCKGGGGWEGGGALQVLFSSHSDLIKKERKKERNIK